MGKLAEVIYKDLLARGKKSDTALRWRTWAERFETVAGIRAKYTRNDVIDYLEWCRRQGFAQNSINTMLRPLKLIAQIQGWQFPKLSMKKVEETEVNRPMFKREEVEEMIKVGKQRLNERELAVLALSTIYGMRRGEMARPNEPDIRLERVEIESNGSGVVEFGGKIKVYTTKGGPKTEHLIPKEIAVYLEDFEPYCKDEMSSEFRLMMARMGKRCISGYGWHSIRRCLATELLMAEISMLNIVRFMRWSDAVVKGSFGMLALYAKRDQTRIDSEIFKVHPFLKYWK